MALCEVRNVSFTYPAREKAALEDISFSVRRGEFVTLCGSSGSGKTTLLRCLKPSLTPNGKRCGVIRFGERNIETLSEREEASTIGMVLQSPEKQIVTDTVYHELAFGLESLGFDGGEIRARVAETASYFGIEGLFRQKTSTLSGGQKQLLALASVMVMRPEILLLDEPTSRLDPIAAAEFVTTLKKLNEELGTTVLLSEHRTEESFAVCDRVILLDGGRILCDDTPRNIGAVLKEKAHPMFLSLPTPIRTAAYLAENDAPTPLTVREGKDFLREYGKEHTLSPEKIPVQSAPDGDDLLCVRDVFFRYEKKEADIVSGLSFSVKKGEIWALLGGNGVGKTTVLGLLSGVLRPTRGRILYENKPLSAFQNPYRDLLGVLPQNPQTLFSKNTLYDELYSVTDETKSETERREALLKTASLCRLTSLLSSHPYDLSGGEQQRAALAVILLRSPRILLLDEPTKGMDGAFKTVFGSILAELKKRGMTTVLVSHDTEFCAENADRCALLFDGSITSCDTPRRFFSANSYYTTAASRMSRSVLPYAVTVGDILSAAGKNPKECRRRFEQNDKPFLPEKTENEPRTNQNGKTKPQKGKRLRMAAGFVSAAFLVLLLALPKWFWGGGTGWLTTLKVLTVGLCAVCFVPYSKKVITADTLPIKKNRRGTGWFLLFYGVLAPLTVAAGAFLFENQHYYAVATAVLAELMIPFFLSFERKKPSARYVVLLGSLCALTVAGRAAFFMLPQFKPVAAMVILTGLCFGTESGFLTGALSAFLSNFLFGQGPWTPWQMFSFGLIGGLSGRLTSHLHGRINRTLLTVYGFLITLLLYGGIMNPASVLMFTSYPTEALILSAYVTGFPMDLIHALSTAFFLWILAEPMIERMNRIGKKLGL